MLFLAVIPGSKAGECNPEKAGWGAEVELRKTRGGGVHLQEGVCVRKTREREGGTEEGREMEKQWVREGVERRREREMQEVGRIRGDQFRRSMKGDSAVTYTYLPPQSHSELDLFTH